MGKPRSLFQGQTSAFGAGGFTGGSVRLAAALGRHSEPRARRRQHRNNSLSRLLLGGFGSGESKHSSAPTWLQHPARCRLVIEHFNQFKSLFSAFSPSLTPAEVGVGTHAGLQERPCRCPTPELGFGAAGTCFRPNETRGRSGGKGERREIFV